MTTDKRRLSAKDDEEDEETNHRRKSLRIQEIRQFLTSHKIVLAAHCHVTDRLQSTSNIKPPYTAKNPNHHAQARDHKRYKT